MTINDAFGTQILKPVQILERGSVLLLAIAASLMLGFRLHNRLVLGAALAVGTVIVPGVYVLSKRLRAALRSQEIESRLVAHTRTFLNAQEPQVWMPSIAPQESDPETLGERLLAALNTDGRALPRQSFRYIVMEAGPKPLGECVVFDALPTACAMRQGATTGFPALDPIPAAPPAVPLGELLADTPA